MSDELVKFVAFSSDVSVQFWHVLVKKKLEDYKLSEKSVDLVGYYNIATPSPNNPNAVAYFELDEMSFEPISSHL